MTDLIACLSSSEKGRAHVKKLIEMGDWTNVFLIATESSGKEFSCKKKAVFVTIDEKSSASEMIKDIQAQLKGKINDLEIALNLVCGSGKEHMAAISSVIRMGLGFRLMAVTKDGVCEI